MSVNINHGKFISSQKSKTNCFFFFFFFFFLSSVNLLGPDPSEWMCFLPKDSTTVHDFLVKEKQCETYNLDIFVTNYNPQTETPENCTLERFSQEKGDLVNSPFLSLLNFLKILKRYYLVRDVIIMYMDLEMQSTVLGISSHGQSINLRLVVISTIFTDYSRK